MPGPGFIPGPGMNKLVVEGDFRGEKYCLDLWFKYTAGAITPTAQSALGFSVESVFLDALAVPISNDVTFRRIRQRDYTTISSYVFDASITPLTGAGTDAMPNNVAQSVSFRTSLAGRSFRGRNYVGGVPRSVVTENAIDDAWTTLVVNAYALMMSPTFATNWQWVVVSAKNAKAWRTELVATPIVEVIAVDNIVDTLQKRLPGRGQ